MQWIGPLLLPQGLCFCPCHHDSEEMICPAPTLIIVANYLFSPRLRRSGIPEIDNLTVSNGYAGGDGRDQLVLFFARPFFLGDLS
jgi:hypothetical protein